MPTVEFSSPSLTCHGPDVKLTVGGVDLARFSKAVSIQSSVGQATMVRIDTYAAEGFDVVLEAEVAVEIAVLPGYVLKEATQPDGSKHYSAVRASGE